MMFNTGLVVGKFSPLHDGHLYLIRQAASQCHRLIVISYSVPEFPHCEHYEREYWFSRADLPANVEYLVLPPTEDVPANDCCEDSHREFCAYALLDHFETSVDAVFSSETYGQGFADFLTRFFTLTFNQITTVASVVIDLERKRLPISGTAARASELERRAYTSAYVQASFAPRIVLLGGESTGKSTLAEALATRLKTIHVPEYGRTYCKEIGGVSHLKYQDLYSIGETQIRMERAFACSVVPFSIERPLICDTSALTTMFYSEQLFNRVNPLLAKLAQRRYDHTFLCAPDFPFVQDGTRADETFRNTGHQWFLSHLKNTPYTLLTGSIEQRILTVVSKLKELNNGTN